MRPVGYLAVSHHTHHLSVMPREIQLTKGFITIVDDDDFAHLSLMAWHVTNVRRGHTYAVHSVRCYRDGRYSARVVLMHRHILGLTDPAMQVDHVNGNTLDNRRSNLRVATRAQNSRNRSSSNRVGFKGVELLPNGQYRARLQTTTPYRRIGLGQFDNAEDAARAWDAAAREAFGEFARLNFP